MPSNIPRIRTLMEDPIFRAYMKRVPPSLLANTQGQPWQVWAETTEHKWRTGLFTSYRDVWPVFLKNLRDPETIHDVTITSRRTFWAPPGEWYKVKVRKPRRPTPDDASTSKLVIENRWRQTFHWDGYDLHWCGRCRRPVYWMPLIPTHHALRRLPAVTEEDNTRCLVCGIRWIATPDIDHMVKMEPIP